MKNTFSHINTLHNRSLAVPSWVIAGTIAENAAFIHAQNMASQCIQESLYPITEIGLCFFETASCIGYTEDAFPVSLSKYPFTWHVHLPSDLPWHKGGACVAHIAVKLMDKVAFLQARHAVLHPPLGHEDGGVQALHDFIAVWIASGRQSKDIHIENIDGHDLISLWPTIIRLGCKVCLDTGHLLCYAQNDLLSLLLSKPLIFSTNTSMQNASYYHEPLQHIGMIHLCAAETSGRHAPLTAFNPEELALVGHLCRHVSSKATLMLELFTWPHVEASRRILQNLLKDK